ncbi:MAG TPA: hypothetical protein VJ461_06890, partial [Candidatus Nanoarchaeia archaeon]|nr:hypothetical protein [Candidatus Nanoarchaeia archaeon]
GAGALVPGVGWFVAGGLAVGAGAGALWGLLQSNEVQWYALPLFYEYNAEALKKIGCEISPVKQTKNDAVT